MTLAGQIFDPKNRFVEGRILSASDGLVKALTIYVWPSGIEVDEKLAFLAYLTAFGKSDDENSSKWATWMYTYIVLCFENMEDLIKRLGGREFKFEKLPVSLIKAVSELKDIAVNFDGSGENLEYTQALDRLRYPERLPSVARSTEFFPDILAAGSNITTVYGYCALLIFLAGKKINDKNYTSITEKRPQNLVDSYSIPEQAAYPLTGEGKMERQAHKMCNQAWVTHAPARMAILTDVAAFASGSTLPQRIVFTVSKMLENVGMQPAYYIHRFLQAYPECVNYACIRPALGVFSASVKEVAQADARIQPYYKVIHGDLTRVFHRNGILALSACAISYEKHMSPSMRNFTLGEGATAAVNMFDLEAAAHGHNTLSAIATRLEAEDQLE